MKGYLKDTWSNHVFKRNCVLSCKLESCSPCFMVLIMLALWMLSSLNSVLVTSLNDTLYFTNVKKGKPVHLFYFQQQNSPQTNNTTIPVSREHSPHAYIKPWPSERVASNRRHINFQLAFLGRIRLEMLDFSRMLEFSDCGNMNSVLMRTSTDQDMGSMAGGRSRPRSYSYYSLEDSKNYGVQTQTEETFLRPRSRYFSRSTCMCCFFNPNYFADQTGRHGYYSYVDLCFNVVAKLDKRQTMPNTKKTKKRHNY